MHTSTRSFADIVVCFAVYVKLWYVLNCVSDIVCFRLLFVKDRFNVFPGRVRCNGCSSSSTTVFSTPTEQLVPLSCNFEFTAKYPSGDSWYKTPYIRLYLAVLIWISDFVAWRRRSVQTDWNVAFLLHHLRWKSLIGHCCKVGVIVVLLPLKLYLNGVLVFLL